MTTLAENQIFSDGHFGAYGGRYVPETLVPALDELENEYRLARADPDFQRTLDYDLRHFVGRETPLYFAARLSHRCGVRVYIKREDLCHTGAHKINSALGQALLALRLGKRRVVAETGAGQHGVAVATVCARFGLECIIYMGEEDTRRQAPNVARMRLMGAKIVTVTSGSRTLKDATNEAIRDWVTHVRSTHYILGSAIGPHPYPTIVRDFQSVIGREARVQILEQVGRLPDIALACVGAGSNAIGLFSAFIADRAVRLIGVEAAGKGISSGEHCASLGEGRPGVLHGARSYLLQNGDGQVLPTHSISAGLDYPGVGPEHSWLKDTARAEYVSVTDSEALAAFEVLAHMEGILAALESAHAFAYLLKLAPALPPSSVVLINQSGRGDKDLNTILEHLSPQP